LAKVEQSQFFGFFYKTGRFLQTDGIEFVGNVIQDKFVLAGLRPAERDYN